MAEIQAQSSELLVRSSLCEQQYVKALADAAELQRTHDNTVGIVCYWVWVEIVRINVVTWEK